jgi:hypothetical protein
MTLAPGWSVLLEEVEAALVVARRLASERPDGTPDHAVASSLVVRLPEFIRDVRVAARLGRTNEPAYRSVFEQLVASLRAIA